MKTKEEILKEMNEVHKEKKKKPLFKCWGWFKKEREPSTCPRCLEVLWGWIFLVLVLIGIIIFLVIYIISKKNNLVVENGWK